MGRPESTSDSELFEQLPAGGGASGPNSVSVLESCSLLLFFSSASGGVFAASRAGGWVARSWPAPQATDQTCMGTLGWSSSWQPVGDSCTSRDVTEGAHHQPEDVPYGRFGPDLPHHPPLSDGHRAPERDLKSLASLGVDCCGTLQLCAQGITAQAKIRTKIGCVLALILVIVPVLGLSLQVSKSRLPRTLQVDRLPNRCPCRVVTTTFQVLTPETNKAHPTVGLALWQPDELNAQQEFVF